jgi:hypothetical protein
MKSKMFLIAALLQTFFAANLLCQKYDNGTRLLKGAEVLSATPLQLDYVLENLSDTAKITVNLHEGKTHLVLNDGSGKWREWWYHQGRWKVKSQEIPVETDPTVPAHVKSITTANITNWNTAYGWGNHATQGYLKNYTLPVATASTLGGVKAGSRVSIAADGTISANPQAWADITGKPTFAAVATSGNYNDLTNRPTIPTAYALPPATAATLGGVKAGSGLTVTDDGTLSSNANTVTYGTFTPVIMGGNYTTYTLSGHSYGRYWRNNRVVYMEIYLHVTAVSGAQTPNIITIRIPDGLSPVSVSSGYIELYPAICIMHHNHILTSPYTQLGGYLEGGFGIIRLTQSGTGASTDVRTIPVNAFIRFSITYML